MDNLQHHVALMQSCETLKHLDDIFQKIMLETGCTEFTYTFYHKGFHINKMLQYEYCSKNMRHWHQHFKKLDYESIDSIGQAVRNTVIPIVWDLTELYAKARATEKKMFKEALDYGLKSGISIPIYNHRAEVAILVIHSKNILQQLKQDPELMAYLHHMALHYHQKVTELLAVKQTNLSLVKLTKRETECLKLTAHNKSAQEIADLLKITPRTVAFHIENANRKLHTKNKYQSIAKIIDLELLKL